ncbi:bacillithiol system redox-active protein YtxJ [Chryseobacterium sp.]|uniref:bacillithiol system redox-active protein YtxJ n=1 Tax=Chryseobacterium sp. TaxID=1871047 RepID=UPI0011CA1BDC|nr:bacillithiol system redox-active protein YtxJ [Chryseobacterium sp.]TXF79397.1 bacillithiol system redox-active protein YtxJ [Chryseobacterium sp.]
MSFLDKIFGSSEEKEPSINFWKKLQSEEDLNAAVKESFEKKVAIFKHSTRCFISKTVLRNFEKEVEKSDQPYSYYFLDLIANRDLSNQIADDLDVIHQSPQLIVLENGKAINNASHQSITLDLM